MSDATLAYLATMRQFAAVLGRDPAKFLVEYGTHNLLEDVQRLMRGKEREPPALDLEILMQLLQDDSMPAIRLAKLSASVRQVAVHLEDVIALPMVLPLKLQDCVDELRAALMQAGTTKREKETLS